MPTLASKVVFCRREPTITIEKTREIDLPPEALDALQSFKKGSESEFVLDGRTYVRNPRMIITAATYLARSQRLASLKRSEAEKSESLIAQGKWLAHRFGLMHSRQ